MQELLPLIPAGATQISEILSVVSEEGIWTYFHGGLPVYFHPEKDKASFRMITSSFLNLGACGNSQIQRAFHVSKSSVDRSLKGFKIHGHKAFFQSKKKALPRSPVFTPETVKKAQELLSSGHMTKADVAKELGIKYDTLKKGIRRGAVVYTRKAFFSGTDKSEMAEEIALLESKLSALKAEKKTTDKHINISELPEDGRFNVIASGKKHLTDTVKMIAYRAETSMAGLIAKEAGTFEQARALLRDVFASDADLIPDEKNKTLTVRLHNLSTKRLDKVLDQLLESLNETETKYPGTNLVLRYERIGSS